MGGGGDVFGEEDAEVVDDAGAAGGGVAFFKNDIFIGGVALVDAHSEVGDGGIEHSGCLESGVLLATVGVPIGETVVEDAAVGFGDECCSVLVDVAVVNPVGSALVVKSDASFKEFVAR